jgi:Domain of unknown function (DUF4919)
MKTFKFTALFLALTAFTLTVNAQDKNGSYEAMASKLKAGDTSVDYKGLRMAFTKTKNYSYDKTDKAVTAKLTKLLSDKNFKEALKQAEAILEKDYVDENAHYIAYTASKELKDETKAAFHKAVLVGLLSSIKDGQDGLTAKTPFLPITIDEEYTMIRFLGYQPAGQSLQDANGHKFDVLDVVNPKTNEKAKFYFNIDIIWEAESKVFGK